MADSAKEQYEKMMDDDPPRDRLGEQFQRVMDEGEGKNRTFIVQMGKPPDKDRPPLRPTLEAIQRRNLLLSTRDALPLPFDDLPAPKGNKAAAAAKVSTTLSVFSKLAGLASGWGVPGADVIAFGLKVLEPLLASDMVRKGTAESLKKESTGKHAAVPRFESSQSASVVLPKDEVMKLRDAVPGIRAVYPNRVLKAPPLVEAKTLPSAIEEIKACAWGLHRIGAPAVWGAYGVRGKGVKVAVLDTGIDPDHPDLRGKLGSGDWAEFDEFGFEVPDSEPRDTGQHGTHCAGIIAGGNESGQWIGVAPEARLAGGLVIPKGAGTVAQILAGMNWAIKKKVDVISMSLGDLTFDPDISEIYSDTIYSALQVGIPVVTAIGNDGGQTTGSPGNDFWAFSVGATDHRDRVAGFSGGRTHIIRDSQIFAPEELPYVYSKPEVSAPGLGVKSCVPGKGKYKYFNGTSMAAPHVAGAMALLLSALSTRDEIEPGRLAFLLQDLLIGSVDDLGEAGKDHRYGFGRIDAFRAVGFLKELGY